MGEVTLLRKTEKTSKNIITGTLWRGPHGETQKKTKTKRIKTHFQRF
jgi:hypothetical protein